MRLRVLETHRVASAGLEHLEHRVLHVVGVHELSLLDVHDALCLRRGDKQVCLAAEKRRDLHDVDHLGDAGYLDALMHVRQDLVSELLLDFLQQAQPLFQTRPPVALQGGTVRFVEARLEVEIKPIILLILLQRPGNF